MSEHADMRHTADEIVFKWADNMSKNARHHYSDFEADYETRRGFYANDPGLGKYMALVAYLECYPLDRLDFTSPDEELEAWQRTFGLVELDNSREALKAVLDDHFQAMSKAYDAEVSSVLSGITL